MLYLQVILVLYLSRLLHYFNVIAKIHYSNEQYLILLLNIFV